MTDEGLAWIELLEQDAHAAAQLLQLPTVERPLRQRGRALLWQVYAALDAVSATLEAEATVEPAAAPEADAEPPRPAPNAKDILVLQQAMQAMRRELGDDRGAGARRIGAVWVRTPMPPRPTDMLPSVRLTEWLVRAVTLHFRSRVALTPARLAWFEERCGDKGKNPTKVAMVRQPEQSDSRDSLELLTKNGKSKFS